MGLARAGGASLLWLARGSALLLALFWGAFLIEHLVEWYGDMPPRVVLAMGFHFGMIAGFVTMLHWPRAGVPLVAVTSIAFFTLAGFGSFPGIALLNLVPIVLLAAAWLASAQRGRVIF
ncbi:MAG: hypothetical protein IPM24_27470 [Bryobacterales bacterium]|nr:hypothetical protein [Bryobacterales bacterium]